MEKAALNRIVRTIYRRLRDPGFVVKLRRLKDCQGRISVSASDDQIVEIALRPDCQLIPTVIHEVLHSMNMLLPEQHVLSLEREVMANLSHRRMANIVIATGKALKRSIER